MINGKQLVILDAEWEIRNIGDYVDDVLVEFNECRHLRNELIRTIILSRLQEISLMFAEASLQYSGIPEHVYRYLHSVPIELNQRIDKEMYKRERFMRARLGECKVTRITIKIKESLLEIECRI